LTSSPCSADKNKKSVMAGWRGPRTCCGGSASRPPINSRL
jgi:hypothetical protein